MTFRQRSGPHVRIADPLPLPCRRSRFRHGLRRHDGDGRRAHVVGGRAEELDETGFGEFTDQRGDVAEGLELAAHGVELALAVDRDQDGTMARAEAQAALFDFLAAGGGLHRDGVVVHGTPLQGQGARNGAGNGKCANCSKFHAETVRPPLQEPAAGTGFFNTARTAGARPFIAICRANPLRCARSTPRRAR